VISDAEAAALLARSIISRKRLSELGLGSVGITLNPHLLLTADGRRTGWVAKRLRSRWYRDPNETFARFRREHELLCRYFGTGDQDPSHPGTVPETHFIIVDRSFDDDGDYLAGREYVMIQEFVAGSLLCDTLAAGSGTANLWLRRELARFVESYERLQRDEAVVPDCFSIRSDHLRADPHREVLVLVDTNNLLDLRAELEQLPSIRSLLPPNLAAATASELRAAMGEILGQPEPSGFVQGSGPRNRDIHTLAYLARWFPPCGEDNPLLAELKHAVQTD
jgi:hypothetical protein